MISPQRSTHLVVDIQPGSGDQPAYLDLDSPQKSTTGERIGPFRRSRPRRTFILRNSAVTCRDRLTRRHSLEPQPNQGEQPALTSKDAVRATQSRDRQSAGIGRRDICLPARQNTKRPSCCVVSLDDVGACIDGMNHSGRRGHLCRVVREGLSAGRQSDWA